MTALKITRPDTTISLATTQQDYKTSNIAWFAVLVAALGYFVDVFDLWLFANVRVASLTSLGLTPEQVTSVGAELINWQQTGLLIGGFAWGMLADKKGRASVMFASILLYSVANLLNGFATTVVEYKALRFFAGLGLAGEIGAGITLVSELLPKAKRGIGVTLVTSLGVSGACFAALASKYLDWRTAFIVGGVMGLALLLLRFLVHESGMFKSIKNSDKSIKRGSLLLLFGKRERILRFVSCIFAGVPLFLTFGLFATFAPEIAKLSGILEPVSVADVLFAGALAMTCGDLLAGVVSQKMKSRKVPLISLQLLGLVFAVLLSLGFAKTANAYIALVTLAGLCSGYWACLIAAAAEQFGTNLRGTVTTALPNIVRASIIPINLSFVYLKSVMELSNALLVITCAVYGLAFWGMWYMKETFHKDLDYIES